MPTKGLAPLPSQSNGAFPLKKTAGSADMKNKAALKKACQDFEAIILQQMLTAMRKSVPKSGLLDSGYAQDMYQSMYDENLAKEMASSRGIGLADALFRQLSSPPPRKDEAQPTTPRTQI